MSRFYDTQEEYDANKEGHNDQQRHRINYEHDRHSDDPEAIAYWQGRQDEERKQRIEEEERQMEEDRLQREFERQMREEEIRSRVRHAEEQEDIDEQTVSDYDAMESQDDERPSSEEDLFRDILRNERGDND